MDSEMLVVMGLVTPMPVDIKSNTYYERALHFFVDGMIGGVNSSIKLKFDLYSTQLSLLYVQLEI